MLEKRHSTKKRTRMASRLLLVLSFVLVLQGCGLGFWYNRMDWVISWYVDDYIELTDAQETQLEQWAVAKIKWHRHSELPKYIEWFTQLKQDIESGALENKFSFHSDQMERLYRRILEGVTDDLLTLSDDYTDEQLLGMLKKIQEEDNEIIEEYQSMSQEERSDDRYDDIRSELREQVGRLRDSQKQLAKDWAAELRDTKVERFAFRKSWQDQVSLRIPNRRDPKVKSELRDLITSPKQLYSQTLLADRAHNSEVSQRYLLKFYKSMSKKQKKRMVSGIDDYIETFTELAAQKDS